MPILDQATAGSQQPNAAALNRTLFISDNLPILRGIDSESVDLIATDPPFNKGVKAFEGIVAAGTDKEGKKVSYKDTWTWGDVQNEWTQTIKDDHPNLHAVIHAANAAAGEDMGAYLCWLSVRVLEMHRILKPTGSIYVHIDHTAHAYVKAMMDAIFGRKNFRNEIVWSYQRWTGATTTFQRMHDTLLFYSKTGSATFNQLQEPYSSKSMHKGRRHSVVISGGLEQSYTADTSRLKAMRDVWEISYLNSQAKERTGHPTQKPLALYDRIIRASSNEDNLVLDPFAGCATTCVAAERLGRRWIAIDINREARGVVLKRLRKEARLPSGGQSWNRAIRVKTRAPKRTDDGAEAAPELTLVSPRPKAPRLTARELRARLVLSDGMQCLGCGWVPHHEEYLEVDHKVPKSRDGRDDIRNRVLLCGPCNGAKGNKLTLAELRLRRIEEGRMADKTWTREWYDRTGRFA